MKGGYLLREAESSWFGIVEIYLLDDLEPWRRGDPETYVEVRKSRRCDWIKDTVDLPRVNDVCIRLWLGDGGTNPTYFFYDLTYHRYFHFHFKEADWPDADDSFGSRCIDRDTVPWG